MINRILKDDIKSKLFKGKAIFIYGPRQAGKTTLVNELIQEENLDVVTLTGDDDVTQSLFETVTSSRWTQILGSKKCVFIDEGHKIKNLGRSIKLLVDSRKDVQVIVTGSSSFKLVSLFEEPLTGRKFEYKLLPLSYQELANHYGFVDERKNLELRLIYGSYPEVVTNQQDMKEILSLISESYLYKDLFQYEGIRKPQVLEKLLKALALQCGSEVSMNEISTLLGVSRTLVESYIQLLVQAYIVFPLTSYSTNQRNELKKSCKYYFWDNGIRNSIIKDFTPLPQRNDVGILFENYLVSERLKRNLYSKADGLPYFWRTTDQMEVDYIEALGTNLSAYEFKYNPAKQSRITKAFANRYPQASLQTITIDNYDSFLAQA
jgi:uncharacterized protein